MKNYFIILFLLFFSGTAYAQWQKCDGPDGGSNSYLTSDGVNLYSWGWGINDFFISADGGQTWVTPACAGLPPNPSITLVKSVNNKLYVGATTDTSSGFFVSANQGKTFTPVGANYVIQAPSCMAVSGNDIFIAYSTYLYHSADGGTTWSLFVNGLNLASVNDLLITGNTVFAATGTGIFSTLISGTSWQQGGISNSLKKVAVNNGVLYAAGSSFYSSINNGTTWNTGTTGLSGDFDANDLLVDNGIIYITLVYGYGLIDYGVYTTSVSGINWQFNSNGLRSTQNVENLANVGNTVFCSTHFAGIFKTINSGLNWTDVKDPESQLDVYSMAIDSGNIYAATGQGFIFKSNNNGQSWNDISNDLTPDLNFGAMDAKNNLVIATGYLQGVYRSVNGGTHWTKAGSGITDSFFTSVAIIDSVVVLGDQYVGIFRSTDYGVTWNLSNNGLANYYITCLVASGNNLFAGTNGGGVYLSTDKGITWAPVNNGIQHFDVFRLYADGANIYATASTQYEKNSYLYLSNNNGTSWSQIFNHAEIVSARGNTIYAMPYFGNLVQDSVYRSTDGGITWAADQLGLNIDTLYCTVTDAVNVYIGAGLNSVWYEGLNATGIVSVNAREENGGYISQPGQHTVTLQALEAFPQQTEVELTDLSGRIIITTYLTGSQTIIPVNNLSKGMYLVNIKSGSFLQNEKVVVE